jgi:uncharacterized protein YkwD
MAMIRTALVRGALAGLVLLGALAVLTAPAGAHDPHTTTTAEAGLEWDVWCLVNQTRLRSGRVPLPMNANLRNNVARPWAINMAHSGNMVHRGDFLAQTQRNVPGTNGAGENIGYDQSATALFNAWMNSPPHRANILNTSYEYIGIGIDLNRTNFLQHWGVQNFASTTAVIEPVYPVGQRFIDVCDSNTFFSDIGWMYDAGITTGTVYPRYRIYNSTGTVSRSALAAFLYRTVTPGTGTAAPACTVDPYPYNDVGNHQFRNEICWLRSSGIDQDDSPGQDEPFSPSQPASRARMADWLFRAADINGIGNADGFQPPAVPTFSDVPRTSPYYEAIEWAAASRITNGYPDGTFQPSGSITRQAMAAMFHRFDALPG